MSALRAANLALAFVLELAMLAALAVWGWSAGTTAGARLALAVGAPLAAGLVWAVFLAPRASRRLRRGRLEVAKLALFLLAALALVGSGHPWLGVALAGTFTVSLALAMAWGQQDVAGRSA